jgi:hypothetical protein
MQDWNVRLSPEVDNHLAKVATILVSPVLDVVNKKN